MSHELKTADVLDLRERQAVQTHDREVLETIQGDIRRLRRHSTPRAAARRRRRFVGLWSPLLGAVGVLSLMYFFFF